MKKTIYILIITTIFLVSDIITEAKDGFVNEGVVNNTGTIIVNKKTVESNGKINNTGGRFLINNNGVTTFNQDTINGFVQYTAPKNDYQVIPQITYDSVSFQGGTKRFTDNNKKVNVLRDFASDSTELKFTSNFMEIISYGTTKHNGSINIGSSEGKVKLNGTNNQDVSGKGNFKVLELDNNSGATVVDGGGFRVSTRLELTNGELRTSAANNIILGENYLSENSGTIGSVEIVRKNGSIAFAPALDTTINVTYSVNDIGRHTTDAEIPDDPTKLGILKVQNKDGLQLTKNVTANHGIELDSNIRTYNTDIDGNITEEYVLAYNGTSNPIFGNDNAEIDGKFRRNSLNYSGQKMLFNNKFTHGIFNNEASANGATSLTFDIKGNRSWEDQLKRPEERVSRIMNITATDADGNNIPQLVNMEYGYAWKASNPLETFSNAIGQEEKLFLQYWNGSAWEDNQTVVQSPTRENDWFYNKAFVSNIGDFGIGFTVLDYLRFMAKVVLEGPFRGETMGVELWEKGIIPLEPEDIYPYNLDPSRTKYKYLTIEAMPDSVVDWVVIEFTDKVNNPTSRYFKTCLLRYDGMLIDYDGSDRLLISQDLVPGIDTSGTTQYYVAIRHRSHLTIITDLPQPIRTADGNILDMTLIANIYPGNTGTLHALKQIGIGENDKVLYGIAGGNNGSIANSIDSIHETDDLQYIWDSMFMEGLYINADSNLDGVVNTRDYNISWNNRDRVAEIK